MLTIDSLLALRVLEGVRARLREDIQITLELERHPYEEGVANFVFRFVVETEGDILKHTQVFTPPSLLNVASSEGLLDELAALVAGQFGEFLYLKE